MVDVNDYYRVLQKIHHFVRPRTYLEIGVRHGESWRFAAPDAMSIGVDPNPRIHHQVDSKAALFQGTSDDFFATRDPRAVFGGLPVDLAFIDGMHQFEFALRDFMNIERVSSPRSVVLLHDCLPIDEETSTREMNTSLWSGDIWKVVVCLKKERPDLQIDVFDTGPTGLAAIQGLNPSDNRLHERYADIEAQYIDLPYSMLGDEAQRRGMLNVCGSDEATIEKVCGPADRFRPKLSHRPGAPSHRPEGAGATTGL